MMNLKMIVLIVIYIQLLCFELRSSEEMDTQTDSFQTSSGISTINNDQTVPEGPPRSKISSTTTKLQKTTTKKTQNTSAINRVTTPTEQQVDNGEENLFDTSSTTTMPVWSMSPTHETSTALNFVDSANAISPDFGPPEVGKTETGPPDFRPPEVGQTETRSSEFGLPEIGPTETGPPDFRPTEVGPTDAGTPEVRQTVVGPPEVGPTGVGLPEVGPTEVGPPEVGPTEVGPPEVGPPTPAPPSVGPPAFGQPGSYYSGKPCSIYDCFYNVLKNISEANSYCCSFCSCSSYCNNLCCNNLGYESTRTQENEHCEVSMAGKPGLDRELKSEHKIASYLIVISCIPGRWSNMSELCIDLPGNDLERLTPVYNHMTSLNYKNKYCVECNMEADNVDLHGNLSMVKWTTVFSCEDISMAKVFLQFQNIENMLVQMNYLPDCWLHWIPPTEVALSSQCISEVDLFPDCKGAHNISEWQDFCYDIDGGDNVTFIKLSEQKSVCFLCGTDTIMAYNNSCHDHLQAMSAVQNTFSGIVDIPNLEHYLRLQPESTAMDKSNLPELSTEDCSIGLTYTPGFKYSSKLKLCYKLVCPPSKFLIDDKCIPLFQQTKGIVKEFRVTYNSTGLSNEKMDNLDADIEKILFQDYDENVFVCGKIMELDEVAGDTVRVVHLSLLNTKYEDIEVDYYRIKQAIANLPEPTPTLNNPLRPIYSIKQYEFGYLTYQKTWLTNAICQTNRAAMIDLQFCDSVLFPYVFMFPARANKDIFINGVTFKEHEYIKYYSKQSESFAQICLSKAVEKLGDFMEQPVLRDVKVNSGCSYYGQPIISFVSMSIILYTATPI